MSTRHLRLGFEATRANKNLNASIIPALQIKATYLSSIPAATEGFTLSDSRGIKSTKKSSRFPPSSAKVRVSDLGFRVEDKLQHTRTQKRASIAKALGGET